jgi:hypothetical protein
VTDVLFEPNPESQVSTPTKGNTPKQDSSEHANRGLLGFEQVAFGENGAPNVSVIQETPHRIVHARSNIFEESSISSWISSSLYAFEVGTLSRKVTSEWEV